MSKPVSVKTIAFTAKNAAQNTPGWLSAALNVSGFRRFRGSASVTMICQTCAKNSSMRESLLLKRLSTPRRGTWGASYAFIL